MQWETGESIGLDKRPNKIRCQLIFYIKKKNIRFYEKIKEQTFTASELVFNDADVKQVYSTKFVEIIAKNSYIPDHVFNTDETRLYWKKFSDD